MRKSEMTKLLILKDQKGQPRRLLQAAGDHLCLVQDKTTRRIELVDSKTDYSETHVLLQAIDLSKNTTSIPLKNIGSLSYLKDKDHAPYDPKALKEEESSFPQIIKVSSWTHGAILGILVLFTLLFPNEETVKVNKEEPLVTINLDEFKKIEIPEVEEPPQEKRPEALPPKRQAVRVVPRTDKSKPLLAKQVQAPKQYRAKKGASKNAPQSFQRLGTLGALDSALKGSRQGFGSGLRASGGGSGGGRGRGSGSGFGNGTMGNGHDSGGGYAQALYGKGMIAGQVGGGGGGFGSGWGNGSRGSGGFGTKGKGGGHEGYGTSRVGGSGVSQFTYPVQEDAVVEGGLDRDAVYMVINKNIGQIAACYELGLQEKPNLKGRVAVDFVINGSGRVSSASVRSSSLNSNKVEHCMISRIRTWKFPAPVGGLNVDVNYPFALQRLSQN